MTQSDATSASPDQQARAAALNERTKAGLIPTALHGATFGFSDEILGGMRAIGSDQTYDQAVAAERAKLAPFRADHPLGAAAIEFGAGIPTGNALLKLVNAGVGAVRGGKALAEGSKAWQGAKAGFVGGAVAGAGNADEGSRIGGAVRGGATGALFGAIVGKIFGQGGQKDRVKETLNRGLTRDGRTAEELLADRTSLPKLTGDPETLTELSGNSMRRIARGVEAMPGEGSTRLQTFARQRGVNQPGDAVADLGKIMGRQSEDTYQLVDDLIAARRMDSQPLYEAAYKSAPIQVTPEVERALASPSGKAALARAQSIMADEAGAGLIPSGGVALTPSPNRTLDVRAIDYIKKGLDDIIDGRVGAEGGLGPNGLRAATALKRSLLDVVDGQMAARGDVDAAGVPIYRLARQTFGNETEVIKAIEAGRMAIGKNPGEIRQLRRALSSDAAKEGFEIGWMQGAADELNSSTVSGQLGGKLSRSPIARDRVSAALGDDADKVAQVEQMLGRRGAIAETNRAFGGSRTTPTAEDVADLTGGSRAGAAAARIGQQGFLGATRQALAQGINRRLAGIDERNAGQVAKELTKTGPDLDLLLKELAAYIQQRGGSLSPAVRTGAAMGAAAFQR